MVRSPVNDREGSVQGRERCIRLDLGFFVVHLDMLGPISMALDRLLALRLDILTFIPIWAGVTHANPSTVPIQSVLEAVVRLAMSGHLPVRSGCNWPHSSLSTLAIVLSLYLSSV
jgi:hypothetical protein